MIPKSLSNLNSVLMQSPRGLERVKEQRRKKREETKGIVMLPDSEDLYTKKRLDDTPCIKNMRSTHVMDKTHQNVNTVHRRIKSAPDCITQFNKSLDFQNSQSTIKTYPPLFLILIILLQQSN